MDDPVKLAAWMIILTGIMFGLSTALFLINPDEQWKIIKSPITDTCYEMRRHYQFLSFAEGLSKIDDEYCHEKEGSE